MAVVEDDGAGVVELVGQGHPAERIPLFSDPLNVGRLALVPMRLGPSAVVRRRVGAPHDKIRYPGTEATLQVCLRHLFGMILERVVEQCGDRLVLVAAVLQHQGADAEQVRDVGDLAGALAHVAVMSPDREQQRILEP